MFPWLAIAKPSARLAGPRSRTATCAGAPRRARARMGGWRPLASNPQGRPLALGSPGPNHDSGNQSAGRRARQGGDPRWSLDRHHGRKHEPGKPGLGRVARAVGWALRSLSQGKVARHGRGAGGGAPGSPRWGCRCARHRGQVVDGQVHRSERQGELGVGRQPGRRRRPGSMWRQAVVEQSPVDGVRLGGELEPGGGSLAARADRDVMEEDVAEQPSPGLAAWRLAGPDAQGELGLELKKAGLRLWR